MVQSAKMGIFTRMSGVTRFGRPVYQSANQQYLYYWAEHASWKIGEDYTKDGAWVTSEDGGNELDAPAVPVGKWYEWKDGGWQANPAITVICTSTEGMCALRCCAQHSSRFSDLDRKARTAQVRARRRRTSCWVVPVRTRLLPGLRC